MMVKKLLTYLLILCISFMVITYNPTPSYAFVATATLSTFAGIAYLVGATAITAGSAYYLYEDFKAIASSDIIQQLDNVVIDSVTGMAAVGNDLYTAIYNYVQSLGQGYHSRTMPVYNLSGIWAVGSKPLPSEPFSQINLLDGTSNPSISASSSSSDRITYSLRNANTSVTSRTHYISYGDAILEIDYISTLNRVDMILHYATATGTWVTHTMEGNPVDLNRWITAGVLIGGATYLKVTSGTAVDSGYWGDKTYGDDKPEDIQGKKAIPPLPLDWFIDGSSSFPDTYSSGGTKTYDLDTTATDVWTADNIGSDTWPYEIPILGDILSGLQSIVNSISNVFTIPDTLNIEWHHLHVGLTDRFPFSIPFDLVAAFTGWQATPAAPQWNISWKGVSHTIDFSVFNPLATIIRWGILIIFNFGLIISTRKLIRG